MDPKTNPSRSLQVSTRIDVRQLADMALLFKKQGSQPRSLSETVSRTFELCHSLLESQKVLPVVETSTEKAIRTLEQVRLSVVNERTKTALLNQIKRETILSQITGSEQPPTLEEMNEALKNPPKTED